MNETPIAVCQPEQPKTTQLYSSAQIAAALGKSKRAVQFALADIPAPGYILARGIPAAAWSISALPTRLREQLEAEALRRNHKDIEHLLAAPAARWSPPMPLNTVASRYIEQAANLQRALAGTLSRLNDLTLSAGEIERLGLEDYRRVFGYVISARHWRRLLERTLSRDGGTEDWSRLEIYLDENPASETPAFVPPGIAVYDFRGLQEIIASFAKPLQPTTQEKQCLWVNALERLDEDVNAGKPARRMKKALLAFLCAKAPFLADNPRALKWSFDRKYREWLTQDRSIEAVQDKRCAKSGNFRAPKLTTEDHDRLIARSLECGGRIAQAWRELLRLGQLSPDICEYYSRNPSDKSYVPRTILDKVKYDAALLDDLHHGPRRAKLNGAYVDRDPSGEYSGDWFQGDDLTAPVYYFEDSDSGLQIVRSQVLILIDCRSLYVLGFVLTGTAAYSALHIRNLISTVHDSYGIPRVGFYFENGSWRARLVTGRRDELDWTGTELGLRNLGLRFRHAKLARAKVIERVIGALQNYMDGEPGYCGRDERRDGFERMEQQKRLVLAGKVPAEKHFMSRTEWFQRLAEICNQYNDEPQGGKYLDGLSPRQGFEKFHNPEGAVRLPESCRYLLATHKMTVRVGRNGISFQFGRQSYTYKNERTGALKGKTMIAWFNPEYPELLSVSDEKMRNVFTVERALPIPAMGATDEQLAEALAKNAQHDAYAKALYRSVKLRFSDRFMKQMFQPVFVDEKTAGAGRQMLEQREKIIQESIRRDRQEVAARQKARQFGFSEDTLARDPARVQKGLELKERAERLRAMEIQSGGGRTGGAS
jgi:hypothetical protein